MEENITHNDFGIEDVEKIKLAVKERIKRRREEEELEKVNRTKELIKSLEAKLIDIGNDENFNSDFYTEEIEYSLNKEINIGEVILHFNALGLYCSLKEYPTHNFIKFDFTKDMQ